MPAAKATVADPGNGATQGPANGCPVVSGFFPSAALQPIFDACTSTKWPFIAQADGFTPDKSELELDAGHDSGLFTITVDQNVMPAPEPYRVSLFGQLEGIDASAQLDFDVEVTAAMPEIVQSSLTFCSIKNAR